MLTQGELQILAQIISGLKSGTEFSLTHQFFQTQGHPLKNNYDANQFGKYFADNYQNYGCSLLGKSSDNLQHYRKN